MNFKIFFLIFSHFFIQFFLIEKLTEAQKKGIDGHPVDPEEGRADEVTPDYDSLNRVRYQCTIESFFVPREQWTMHLLTDWINWVYDNWFHLAKRLNNRRKKTLMWIQKSNGSKLFPMTYEHAAVQKTKEQKTDVALGSLLNWTIDWRKRRVRSRHVYRLYATALCYQRLKRNVKQQSTM